MVLLLSYTFSWTSVTHFIIFKTIETAWQPWASQQRPTGRLLSGQSKRCPRRRESSCVAKVLEMHQLYRPVLYRFQLKEGKTSNWVVLRKIQGGPEGLEFSYGTHLTCLPGLFSNWEDFLKNRIPWYKNTIPWKIQDLFSQIGRIQPWYRPIPGQQLRPLGLLRPCSWWWSLHPKAQPYPWTSIPWPGRFLVPYNLSEDRNGWGNWWIFLVEELRSWLNKNCFLHAIATTPITTLAFMQSRWSLAL